MLKSSLGVLSLILCAVFAVSPLASAQDTGNELFVVSSSDIGDASYLSFTDAVPTLDTLQTTADTVINDDVSYYNQISGGNGLGDFDGDGDLDYIMAIGFGYMEANIYISEKLGVGNDFAAPILVGNWGMGMDDGFYPMDLAVADYDEDGIDDFVLSVDYTPFSGIYLSGQYTGDEKFGFVYRPMKDSADNLIQNAADYSTGADAADFNKDGHADFVIAPSHDEPFYVSLGHGDGTFTTFPFDSIDGGAVSGVAAADFTGDGTTDIVAVYQKKIYVYQGAIIENPEGMDGVTFTYLPTSQETLPINLLAGLDNLEFDGDGYPDLVVSNYGMFPGPAGVAVLVNNGDATFRYHDTYPDLSGTEFNAVTASPWEPPQNVAPEAVIEPADIEGTVGEEIIFDGSNSVDEDGQIVSYAWDFGDQSLPAEGDNPSHTYQQSGTYLVTLTVTDDQGAEASVQAEVVVVEPVIIPPAKEVPDDAEPIVRKVKFSPRKLKIDGKKHKGKRAGHLKAKIRFAEGYDARNVIWSEVEIVTESGATISALAKKKRGFFDKLAKNHCKPKRSISVKFDRKDVLEAIGCPSDNETTLTVRGQILHGENNQYVDFEASGVIRLKMKKGGQCSAD